jgi:hypothetical protein
MRAAGLRVIDLGNDVRELSAAGGPKVLPAFCRQGKGDFRPGEGVTGDDRGDVAVLGSGDLRNLRRRAPCEKGCGRLMVVPRERARLPAGRWSRPRGKGRRRGLPRPPGSPVPCPPRRRCWGAPRRENRGSGYRRGHPKCVSCWWRGVRRQTATSSAGMPEPLSAIRIGHSHRP